MEGNKTSISTAESTDPHANVWECHICIEIPTDPVATSCGHVFCWPCIYQWLRNGPRPCPICRTHLNKDRNILPLYSCGGALAAGPSHSNGNNGDDNSNGDGDNNNSGDDNSDGDGNNNNGDGDGDDGSAVETAALASDHDVIPPRPRNALLFGAMVSAAAVTARLARLESATHEEAEEDSNLQPRLRDLVHEILQERAALELRVDDLEQRNFDLMLESRERAVRHMRWTIILVQHIGRLRQEIDRKDEMLSRANALLPPGWSDGI